MKTFICFLSALALTLTLGACNLDVPPVDCTPGEKECQGRMFYECMREGTAWDSVNCGKKHQFCNVEYECVQCNDNADCQSDDKHCVDRKCEPLSVAACIDGQTKCEDGEVSTCRQKAWENKTKCPKNCNEAKTDCIPVENVCVKGESFCEGKIFKTCNAKLNGFDSKTCYFTEPYCDDIKGCIKCRNSEDCSKSKPICNETTNTCQSAGDVCAEGETMCDRGVFKECNRDRDGFNSKTCGLSKPVCDALKGCVECLNNDDCNMFKPVCNTSTNTCHECDVDEKKCDGNVFKQCNERQSGFDTTVCSKGTPLCDADKGCVQCKSNTDCKDPLKSICNLSTNVCEAPVIVCAKGETKCEDGSFIQCNANQSGYDSTVCETLTPHCDETKGCVQCKSNTDCKDPLKSICNPSTNVCEAPVIVCTKGETKCEGGMFRQCNADQSAYEDIMCDKTTPFCDPQKGCLQCRDSQDCGEKTPICNSSLNLCQGYGDSCSRVLQVCITERDIAKCTDGKWVGMSCAQDRVCDAFAGCIEKPTSHQHDFEQCTFNGMMKYNPGSCTATYSPDFYFSSATTMTNVIEGKSLKLGKNSHAKITIPDGVDKLSVTLKPDEPGVFDFQVKINGQLALSVKDLKEENGETLTRDDINLVGPLEIVIETNEYITIDNFEWTNYP